VRRERGVAVDEQRSDGETTTRFRLLNLTPKRDRVRGRKERLLFSRRSEVKGRVRRGGQAGGAPRVRLGERIRTTSSTPAWHDTNTKHRSLLVIYHH